MAYKENLLNDPSDIPIKTTVSVREKLINLLQCFYERIDCSRPLEDDQIVSDDEDFDTRSQMQEKIEEFIAELKTARQLEVFSLVLLGRNGDGKSLLINLLISLTCPLSDHYEDISAREETIAAKSTRSAAKRKACFDTQQRLEGHDLLDRLEAISFLRLLGVVIPCGDGLKSSPGEKSLDSAKTSQIPVEFNFAPKNYLRDEQRAEEEENVRILDQACLSSPDGVKYGFLIPSAGEATTTTQFSVRLRHGRVFHMLVIFKTAEEIRDELGNAPPCLPEAEVNRSSAEWKSLRRITIIRRLLAQGSCCVTGQSTEYEDSAGFTIHRSVLENIQSPYKIFSGLGKDMMLDRIFVRDQLTLLMRNSVLSCIVKSCVVFCPSEILEGVELVDTPGTGTDDPLQWKQLTDALESANGVLVVAQRNIETNRELLKDLKDISLARKLLETPHRCPLIVFSALDEKAQFFTAETFLHECVRVEQKHKKDRETVKKRNKHALYMLLADEYKLHPEISRENQSLSAFFDAQRSENCKETFRKYVDQEIMPLVEPNLLCTRPLLLSSALRCRDPALLSPHTRSEVVKVLSEDNIIRTIEGLADGNVFQRLEDFMLQLKSNQFYTPVSTEFHFTKEELDAARRESFKTWRKKDDQAERDHLLHSCSVQVQIPVIKAFEDIFVLQYLMSVRSKLASHFDKTKVLNNVVGFIKKGKLDQVAYAFNCISEGKTKSYSLFETFTRNIKCYSKFINKDELAEKLQQLKEESFGRLFSLLIQEILRRFASLRDSRQVRSHETERESKAQNRLESALKEFLPSELEPAFKWLDRLARPRDQNLEHLFEQACRESLRTNLLEKAARCKKKDEYIKVLHDNIDSVYDGIQNLFVERLEDLVRERLTSFLGGLLEAPRSGQRRSGLEVFLRLYKRCFKWIWQKYGIESSGRKAIVSLADSPTSMSDTMDREPLMHSPHDTIQETIEEFVEGFERIMNEGPAGTRHGGVYKSGLSRSVNVTANIERRELQRYLTNQYPKDLQTCSTRPFKPPCLPHSPPIDSSTQLAVLRKLVCWDTPGVVRHTSCSDIDGKKLAVIRSDIGENFIVGTCGNLFEALIQLARREIGPSSPEEQLAMRKVLTEATMTLYFQPDKGIDSEFELRWGEILNLPLEERGSGDSAEETAVASRPPWTLLTRWADRVLMEDHEGDPVVLDAFSRHFSTGIWLWTTGPQEQSIELRFPLQREGERPSRRKNFIMIAQTSFNRYVPLWPAGTSLQHKSSTYHFDSTAGKDYTDQDCDSEHHEKRATFPPEIPSPPTADQRDLYRKRKETSPPQDLRGEALMARDSSSRAGLPGFDTNPPIRRKRK